MSSKKPTKQEQAIELLKGNYNCELSKVVDSDSKGFKIVLGYKDRNHVRLIEYTHKNKYAKVLKSSTEVSFEDMVIDNTVVIEDEVSDKKE